jgi:hypothetical protein
MKNMFLAIIILGVTSSAYAQVGRNRANYRTCTNIVPVCINNGNTRKEKNVTARCASARQKCMETGIWTSPYTGQTQAADKQ